MRECAEGFGGEEEEFFHILTLVQTHVAVVGAHAHYCAELCHALDDYLLRIASA